ncbi:MAG: holo-[acyl-carrier-protein] synthase [Acidobacteria bacterium]|nr:MAG: holo-[acyl-carrier-protein] synthase [Acidobacteriota bacterium]
MTQTDTILGDSSGPSSVIGLGIDAIEIERIGAAIAKRPRFVERVFAPEERQYCEARVNTAKHFAVRFAAKEAVMKAMGIGLGQVAWREICVTGDGKPGVLLTGSAARRAQVLGIARIEISLTHSRELALAVAAALSP